MLISWTPRFTQWIDPPHTLNHESAGETHLAAWCSGQLPSFVTGHLRVTLLRFLHPFRFLLLLLCLSCHWRTSLLPGFKHTLPLLSLSYHSQLCPLAVEARLGARGVRQQQSRVPRETSKMVVAPCCGRVRGSMSTGSSAPSPFRKHSPGIRKWRQHRATCADEAVLMRSQDTGMQGVLVGYGNFGQNSQSRQTNPVCTPQHNTLTGRTNLYPHAPAPLSLSSYTTGSPWKKRPSQ